MEEDFNLEEERDDYLQELLKHYDPEIIDKYSMHHEIAFQLQRIAKVLEKNNEKEEIIQLLCEQLDKNTVILKQLEKDGKK